MPTGQYLIAICDVLGFTNLVGSTPLDQIAQRYLSLLAELDPHPLFRITPATYEREVVLNRVVFSDTILMWAPAGDTMEILPFVLAQLMGNAVGSMPLRAGLAFGECVIDPGNELYIGQPIVDAYRTEQAQEWMGGAFHPSCWARGGFRDALLHGGSAIEYPVPVKAKAPPLEYALNWPGFVGADFSVDVLTTSETHPTAAAKVTWLNARRFYEAVVNRSGRR